MTDEQIVKIIEMTTEMRLNQFFKNMQNFFDLSRLEMTRTTHEVLAIVKKMIEDNQELKGKN